jgi:hypothetical protein
MKRLAGITIIAIGTVFATQAFAQGTFDSQGRAPGKASATRSTNLTATVVAVDKANRDITLKGPKGNELVVNAAPDVKNFDQIKVGDQVDVQYVRALVLELKKGGGQPVQRSEQASSAGASPGASPAGVVGRRVTVVADVVAVDPATQTITLKGPQRTIDVEIPDPVQFKNIAKGDQVEATYSQALAMKVTSKK